MRYVVCIIKINIVEIDYNDPNKSVDVSKNIKNKYTYIDKK